MGLSMMGKIKKRYGYFWILLLLMVCTSSYALPFNIIPKSGTSLPTNVNAGSTATAYYTVINQTQASRNNNYVKYLPPNVTQVTTGGTYDDTCGATFNLAGNQQAGDSCTLQLTVLGAVNANDPDPHHHLFVCFPGGKTCAGTNYPLDIIQSNPPSSIPGSLTISLTELNIRINGTTTALITLTGSSGINALNVTIESNNPGVATVFPANCVLSTTSNSCTVTITGVSVGTTTFNANATDYSPAITNTQTVDLNYAYVTNIANVLSCPINPINGSIDTTSLTCTTISSPFSGLGLFDITLNPSNTMAYIVDNNAIIYHCSAANNTLSNCQVTASAIPGGYLNFVAIDPSNTYAYIPGGPSLGSGATTIYYCAIGVDGGLNSCLSSGTFVYAQGVAIDPLGTYAYVVDGGANLIYYCEIQPNGALDNCQVTGSSGIYFNPVGITISPDGAYAYIANSGIFSGANEVIYCSIALDHTLTNCQSASDITMFPYGISFEPSGSMAYVTNDFHTVYNCTIDTAPGPTHGRFTACNANIGFNNPFGVSIN